MRGEHGEELGGVVGDGIVGEGCGEVLDVAPELGVAVLVMEAGGLALDGTSQAKCPLDAFLIYYGIVVFADRI